MYRRPATRVTHDTTILVTRLHGYPAVNYLSGESLHQHTMPMKNRQDITVGMPKELDDAIHEHLVYGDSKAEWIREAIRQRLNQDDADVGPDTALEAHSSESDSESESDSDSESVLVSPDEQSTRGGIMQRPK